MGIALTIFAAMIVAAASGLLSMLEAAMLAAGAMVFFVVRALRMQCSIDWSILVVIGASIALGQALDKTGAAIAIAQSFIDYG